MSEFVFCFTSYKIKSVLLFYSIKGQLKCTSSVTHTESESTIAEKDSNENNSGEQSGEPKDSLVTTAVKIGEKKLVTTCGQPDDKASILKGTQSLTVGHSFT